VNKSYTSPNLLLPVLMLCVLLLLGTLFVYRGQQQASRAGIEHQLVAIANLKVG
jgi:H+/Cl- antiporter ClcA